MAVFWNQINYPHSCLSAPIIKQNTWRYYLHKAYGIENLCTKRECELAFKKNITISKREKEGDYYLYPRSCPATTGLGVATWRWGFEKMAKWLTMQKKKKNYTVYFLKSTFKATNITDARLGWHTGKMNLGGLYLCFLPLPWTRAMAIGENLGSLWQYNK